MVSLTNPGSVVYPVKFKAGDEVVSKVNISFGGGAVHEEGQCYTVTVRDVSYYNVNHEFYEKKL